MGITVTFRQIEPNETLKGYAVDKITKLDKVINNPFDASVILSVKKYRHIAEVLLTAKGISVKAIEETDDLFSAIDLVVDKVEKQVKKFREKRKEHANYGSLNKSILDEVIEEEDISVSGGVEVVRLNNSLPKPMTMDDAVKHLEFSGKDVLLFLNFETNTYNVVCRLKDGRVGFIEP
ncbi:MAG: ribosome-associated translation inhibitor RaiA [Deltaproteobacteria bacterium]|nr:ribosome-associated translation inhibitor RaiA [Deltaproteobacteria bacterium]NIS78568.1 ribosome-associated translation inhibitor RaiA [Deltaproteobacteria bacterium]